MCMCVCMQKAPFGMNYLGVSLFCLSMVDWPLAHKVLLLTAQGTIPIQHQALLAPPHFTLQP